MSRAYLLFFFVSIAILGLIFGFFWFIPLRVTSFLLPSKLGSKWVDLGFRGFKRGAHLLLSLQPWFKGADIELKFPETVQGRSLLIVSNHRSHLDVFVLLSQISGIRILAKSDLFHVPFLGFMLWAMGHVKIKRGDPSVYFKTLDRMGDMASASRPLLIFPEMTRCREGLKDLQRFDSAVFRMAFQKRIPVIPIVLSGTDAIWPKGFLGFRLNWNQKIRAKNLALHEPEHFSSPMAFKNAIEAAMKHELSRQLEVAC